MKKNCLFCVLLPLMVSCQGTSIFKDNIQKLDPATKASIQMKVNDFSYRLYDIVNDEFADENVVISPLSCSNAVSLAGLGASGDTFDEIASALGTDAISNEELGSYSYEVWKSLKDADEKVTMVSANSIWLGDDFHVKSDYKKQASLYYDAKVSSVGGSSAGKVINQWVAEKTNSLIKNAVPDDFSLQDMAFVNAVYFNSPWPSEPRKTSMPFHAIDGTASSQSTIMFEEAFLSFSNDKWQYVSLPFGEEKTFCLELIQPKGASDLDISKDVAAIRSAAKKNHLDVYIPIIDITTSTTLDGALQHLGMKKAFKSSADFGKITDKPLCLGTVYHNAMIRVDEKGGVGAASTVISGPTAAGPGEEVRFDQPFVFFISEATTGTVLFIGHKLK